MESQSLVDTAKTDVSNLMNRQEIQDLLDLSPEVRQKFRHSTPTSGKSTGQKGKGLAESQ